MKTNQNNRGLGNTNNINSNNQFTCTININGKEECVDVLSVLKAVSSKFEKIDERINSTLPNKVLVNKTNGTELYQTDKIITSLLQLGVPLTATYEIAQATINRIKEFIYQYADSDVVLTTKDIRTMVSKSIQDMDIEKFPYSDIERWNNQYIRRYGHNNRRVTVYHPDSEKSDEISYDYINNVLAKAIVYEITKGRIQYEDLLSRYRGDIATEILGFINRCDLYKINYYVLKEIIKEIALQPPHPWFINEYTRNEIIDYDIKCLHNNINKLQEAIKDNVECAQSVKIEVLHHASALMLEKYDFFLGCYDLSAFYLLKDMLNELNDTNKWDLTVGYSRISKILSDLSFAGIDSKHLLEIVDIISDSIKSHNINNNKIDRLMLEYGHYALRLIELGYKEDVSLFLNSGWNNYTLEEAVRNLKLLLYSIYPVKSWNLKTQQMCFWINYKSIYSEIIEDIKNQIFVVYNDGTLSDYEFLEHLKNARTMKVCNVIFVIAEKKEISLRSYEIISKYLAKEGLASMYIAFWLCKDHLREIFKSENKMRYLEEMMAEQITL